MNRLKELRLEKNLYQKDLAKMINMSQNCYSQYETETLDLPPDILIKLADIYNVNIDYILDLTDIKKPYSKSKVIKPNNFFNRLREIREDKDLTQEDIAKVLHKTARGYGKNENNNNDPSTKDLKALAIFYNVSIDYLLYNTDERTIYKRKN